MCVGGGGVQICLFAGARMETIRWVKEVWRIISSILRK